MRTGKLYLFGFMEGAFVVSIELGGGKLLAPVFGTSLYVWTSVIGVTLACLTVGYLLGGFLSAKERIPRKLFFLFILAAGCASLMPLLAEELFLYFTDMNLFLSCVLMALLLMGVPLVCLGATSALLIQCMQEGVEKAGKVAGRLYAISTCGGIMNTFLLGFFIIPAYGISNPLLISCFLVAAPMLVMDGIKIPARLVGLCLVGVVIVMVYYVTNGEPNEGGFEEIYRSEGIMGQLKVVDYRNENQVLNRALLTNNSAQSIITKTNVTAISQYNYVHFISSLAALKPENSKVLLLGMAGGSLAYELQNLKFKIDVVDIDERMFSIAERYFYFQKENTGLFTDDARHYIRTTKKKYDMVIIDISASELQPSYLYTGECFKEVKNILSPGGFFFVNFQGVLEGDSPLALATWSVHHTLRASGFHTYYYSFNSKKADDVQFIASPGPIAFRQIDSSRVNTCCSQNKHVIKFLEDRYLDSAMSNTSVSPVLLTDDKPLLEKLKYETVVESRNSIRKDLRMRTKK